MAGYYIPSSFAGNYVSNKKNEDGTYAYDSAVNKVGIDAQRSLQQLNKQYNVTINQAHGGSLLANRGLRASALGTGYKQAFAERLQASVNDEVAQVGLSVANTKQNIFDSLANNLGQIGAMQQQEMSNIGRMAGSLEQYHEYVKTLRNVETNQAYTEVNKFKVGDGYSFEDNYDQLFGINNGGLAGYTDDNAEAGLNYTEWLRRNSGNSAADTGWLDWAYGGGMDEYKNFIKNGVHSIYPEFKYAPPVKEEVTATVKNEPWYRKYIAYGVGGS